MLHTSKSNEKNKMIIENRVRIVAQKKKLLAVCIVRILPSFLLWVILEMEGVFVGFDGVVSE